uniref:Tryptophan-rich basic protein n=1 Tax=Panagrellus redivivus TaxID=6233 RepID=A0A7E4UP30_PANRE
MSIDTEFEALDTELFILQTRLINIMSKTSWILSILSVICVIGWGIIGLLLLSQWETWNRWHHPLYTGKWLRQHVRQQAQTTVVQRIRNFVCCLC